MSKPFQIVKDLFAKAGSEKLGQVKPAGSTNASAYGVCKKDLVSSGGSSGGEDSDQVGEMHSDPKGVSSAESADVFLNAEDRIKTTSDVLGAVDTAGVLKAFRCIGNLDGIQESDLRFALGKLRNASMKKEIQKKLHDIFEAQDVKGTGRLDVFGFEQMIRSSALLEKAIYELMEMEELENNDEQHTADDDSSEHIVELAVSVVILVNIIIMAISTDNDPGWLGWQVIECGFLVIFMLEISFRLMGSKTVREYLSHRMNIFDVVITTVAVIDVSVSLSSSSDSDSMNVISILRIFRLARLARLVKVVLSCREMVMLLEGLVASFHSVLWSFVLLGMVVFLWAIIIRQSLVYKVIQDDDGVLTDAFPNIPEVMLMMFRCWVLSSEGACMSDNGASLYNLFSSDAGWFFKSLWVFLEVFVCLGVLNVVVSTFVCNTMRVEKTVEGKIAMSGQTQSKHTEILTKLDKLLRTLTHPHRKHANPKDRNVADVAKYIHTNFPDNAGRITDMSKTLLGFAETIQDALEKHATALGKYEAVEVSASKKLHDLPTAKMYLVDGEDRLMVDDENCFGEVSKEFGIEAAPAGAMESLLVQESNDLTILLAEAKELQTYVRSFVRADDKKVMESKPSSIGATMRSASSSVLHTTVGSNMMHRLHHGAQHHDLIHCDYVVDPGPKNESRIKEKVLAKYSGRYERNRDYARMSLLYDSVEGLLKSLKTFFGYRLKKPEGMCVVSLENRFAEPTHLGWRDITVLLKVKVPSSGKHHIMEIQLCLKELADVRKECTHNFYRQIRAVLPEEAISVVIDKLTNNSSLGLGITRREWLECLKNREVNGLLDQLGIPNVIRRDAVDIVDADGSGMVSTGELREGLLLCSGDLAMSGGIVDCKLKVREIQQWLRNKVEPQLRVIQEMILHIKQDHFRDKDQQEEKLGKLVERTTMKLIPKLSVSDRPSIGPLRDSSFGPDVRVSKLRSTNSYSSGDTPAPKNSVADAPRLSQLNDAWNRLDDEDADDKNGEKAHIKNLV